MHLFTQQMIKSRCWSAVEYSTMYQLNDREDEFQLSQRQNFAYLQTAVQPIKLFAAKLKIELDQLVTTWVFQQIQYRKERTIFSLFRCVKDLLCIRQICVSLIQNRPRTFLEIPLKMTDLKLEKKKQTRTPLSQCSLLFFFFSICNMKLHRPLFPAWFDTWDFFGNCRYLFDVFLRQLNLKFDSSIFTWSFSLYFYYS